MMIAGRIFPWFAIFALVAAVCSPVLAEDIFDFAADCEPAKLEQAIENGADIAASDEDGKTPLIWAARNGSHACVEVLLKHNPPLDVQDKDGQTALFLAATSSNVAADVTKSVELLVKAGADVNRKMRFGYSPLHGVLAYGSGAYRLAVGLGEVEPQREDRIPLYQGRGYEVSKLLLNAGAAVNQIDEKGYSDIEMAVRNRMPAIIDLMVQHGGDLNIRSKDYNRSMLHVAATSDRFFTVPYLVAKGLDIDDKDTSGGTPLMLATANGHVKTMKVLLEEGAKVDSPDDRGFSPLLYATSKNQLAELEVLLEAGADPNARTAIRGSTPLHYAAHSGSAEAVRLLLRHKADKTIVDRTGQTALDRALSQKHVAVAKLLK